MANWVGSARTNYVRTTKSKEEIQAHLGLIGFNAEIITKEVNGDTLIGFLPEDSDDGSFQSFLSPDIPDEDADPAARKSMADALGLSEDALAEAEEVEFSWQDHIMTFVAAGEVLVVQCVGAEKLRYLTGYAQAYCKGEDGEVNMIDLSIRDIYKKATQAFGVESITEATY